MEKIYTINETYYRKKIVRELFRATDESFDYLFPGVVSYLAKCLRDVSMVLVVEQYYATSFSDSIERFIEEQGIDVLRLYPECINMIRWHAMFLENYIKDICDSFTHRTITDIEVLGDVHDGKVTKVEVITDKGSYIVFWNQYDSQQTLIEYMCKVDESLVPCFAHRSQYEWYLYRPKYEIIQFANNSRDVENYYYYFWRVVAWLLLWQISDQYHENVLCAMPYPIFFDIEVAFCGLLEEYNITSMGVLAQDNSQFATLNGSEVLISYTIPMVIIQEGKPIIERINPSKAKKTAAPVSNLSQERKKECLIAWFNESVLKIKNNLSQIIHFVENTALYARLILRPTREYTMSMRTFQYKLLQESDITCDQRIGKVLGDAYSYKNFVNLGRIPEYEKELLSDYIAPSFYTNIHTNRIITASGLEVWEIGKSHLVLWKDHIDRLGDFLDKQKDIIIRFL